MKKKSSEYYRRITASLPQAKEFGPHLISYLTLFLSVLIVISLLYLMVSYLKYQDTKDRKLQAIDNLKYWQELVKIHPNFTEGYYNAGFYSYALGDRRNAIGYLDRALELDPGFKKASELEKEIRE